MKKSISVRISNRLINWIDGKIEDGKFENRSQAIRFCIRQEKKKEDEVH